MDSSNKGVLENTASWYLKYFKGAVVVVMTLVLCLLLLFLGLAGMSYLEKPVAPAAVKPAPEKQVDFDAFVNFILEREKQKKMEDERNKRGSDVQLVPSNTAAPTVKYLEQATQFYRCIEEFDKASSEQVQVVSTDGANKRIEEYRQLIESYIGRQFLGEAWLVDFLKFSCTALKNPALVTQKKEGKITSIPIFVFHSSVYAAIQEEKTRFEQGERLRVATETAEEELRITAARIQGSMFLALAGSAFATLFALALFLILSRIESNLANIAQSLQNSPGNSLTEPTNLLT